MLGMNPLHVAGAAFLAVMIIKFVVGAISSEVEFTSDGELTIVLLTATTMWAIDGANNPGPAFLGAAIGMFAVTGWTALQFYKVKTLTQLGSGRR